jgi:hypothetical protein
MLALTVANRQSPSSDRFVVKLPEPSGEPRRSLETLGNSAEIANSGLTLLHAVGCGADPRSTWCVILERVKAAEWAAPVLVDEEQQSHFPTGDVTVRFDHVLSSQELERFGADHRLCLVSRNEFIPEQVSFRPKRPREEYLPDLVRAIAADQHVIAAWASTISRYRRA